MNFPMYLSKANISPNYIILFVFQILLPQKNPSACTLGSPYIVPPSSPSCLDSRMGQSSPHTAEQGFSSSKIAETTLLEESPFGNNVFRTSLG